MPRIMIAGVGSIGRRHLANLRRLGIDDIILYRSNGGTVDEWPDIPVFSCLDEALLRSPDAVIISNPTAKHIDVALAAARVGCHLFIEKPLSNSWQGVEELIGLIKKKNLVAMCGFDLRFDPGLCKVRQLVHQADFGKIVSIDAQVGQYLPDWHPQEDYRRGVSATVSAGGGVILDLIHEIDYVTWLLGPVVQIACFADKISDLEIETEDTAALLLRFANGAIGSVRLDYLQRSPSRSCRIVGEKGSIGWDYFHKEVLWYIAQEASWSSFRYPRFERNDRFIAEMRHFLNCVRDHTQPKSDVPSAAAVLKVALDAKEIARKNNIQLHSQGKR